MSDDDTTTDTYDVSSVWADVFEWAERIRKLERPVIMHPEDIAALGDEVANVAGIRVIASPYVERGTMILLATTDLPLPSNDPKDTAP